MNEVTLKSYVPEAIKATKDGAYDGILAMATAITSQAKALAPVDDGLLRNSIMWKSKNKSGGLEGGSAIKESVAENEVIVGSAVEYAIYQEYGTRKMPAQPFLRVAFDIFVNGTKGKEAMKKAVNNSVQEKLKRES